MAQFNKKYPGKNAEEIFAKVHEMMERIAQKLSLAYKSDPIKKAGAVSKLGVNGKYQVKEGEVSIDLHFPMLVPGSMKKKVEEDIQRKLDGLFS